MRKFKKCIKEIYLKNTLQKYIIKKKQGEKQMMKIAETLEAVYIL